MEIDKGICGVIRNWTDIDTLDYSPLDVKELWGLVPRLHSQSPNYSSESATSTEEFWNQSIPASVKSEPPKYKLPRHFRDASDERKPCPYPQSLFPQNFIVSHTILLNQHIKEMQELSMNMSKTDFKPCPPTPSIPEKKFDVSASLEQSKYNFKLGQAPPYPVVDESTKIQILNKSVIIILAQLGFDSAKKSAVHVLVDVLIEWLTKQTRVCHNLAQHDLNRNHLAYDDVLGHSFKIMGIPHVLTLSEYYVRDVVGRRDRQLAKSQHYIHAYNKKVSELSHLKHSKIEAQKPLTSESPQTFQPLLLSNVAECSQNVQAGFQALHIIDTTMNSTQQSPTGRTGVTSIRIGPKKLKKS